MKEHFVDVSDLHPLGSVFSAMVKLSIPFSFIPAEPEVGLPARLSIPEDQVERIEKIEAEMRAEATSIDKRIFTTPVHSEASTFARKLKSRGVPFVMRTVTARDDFFVEPEYREAVVEAIEELDAERRAGR